MHQMAACVRTYLQGVGGRRAAGVVAGWGVVGVNCGPPASVTWDAPYMMEPNAGDWNHVTTYRLLGPKKSTIWAKNVWKNRIFFFSFLVQHLPSKSHSKTEKKGREIKCWFQQGNKDLSAVSWINISLWFRIIIFWLMLKRQQIILITYRIVGNVSTSDESDCSLGSVAAVFSDKLASEWKPRKKKRNNWIN